MHTRRHARRLDVSVSLPLGSIGHTVDVQRQRVRLTRQGLTRRHCMQLHVPVHWQHLQSERVPKRRHAQWQDMQLHGRLHRQHLSAPTGYDHWLQQRRRVQCCSSQLHLPRRMDWPNVCTEQVPERWAPEHRRQHVCVPRIMERQQQLHRQSMPERRHTDRQRVRLPVPIHGRTVHVE